MEIFPRTPQRWNGKEGIGPSDILQKGLAPLYYYECGSTKSSYVAIMVNDSVNQQVVLAFAYIFYTYPSQPHHIATY